MWHWASFRRLEQNERLRKVLLNAFYVLCKYDSDENGCKEMRVKGHRFLCTLMPSGVNLSVNKVDDGQIHFVCVCHHEWSMCTPSNTCLRCETLKSFKGPCLLNRVNDMLESSDSYAHKLQTSGPSPARPINKHFIRRVFKWIHLHSCSQSNAQEVRVGSGLNIHACRSFPAAQLLKRGTSNAKVMGSTPRIANSSIFWDKSVRQMRECKCVSWNRVICWTINKTVVGFVKKTWSKQNFELSTAQDMKK